MKSLPSWVERLLRAICPNELYEQIEGDLIELYNHEVKMEGKRKAKLHLMLSCIRFFRPGILLRNKFSASINSWDLILNYFKIAYRHLMHSKAFSLINVLGLTVSITAFSLIIQYVSFEMSYDRFYTDSERTYRVALERCKNGEVQSASSSNFAGLRTMLRENFPEVDAATGFYKTPANTGVFFKYKGRIYNELGGELNADSSFFNVFPDLLQKGNAATALVDPHSMVLTQSMARKIFGNEEPVGQHLQMPNDEDRETDIVITGVIKDFPDNSHIHANFIVPLVYDWNRQTEWSQDFLHTYIRIKEGVDPKQFNDHLNQVYRKLEPMNPEMKGTRNFLQPITSIHLTSQMQDEIEVNGSQNLVYIASAIGLIILIMHGLTT